MTLGRVDMGRDRIEFWLNTASVILILGMLVAKARILPDPLQGALAAVSAATPILFLCDYLIRLVLRGRAYAKSADGVIDFIAFAPELALMALSSGAQLGYLRVLRIFKLTRLVLAVAARQRFGELLRSVAPLAVSAFCVKILVSLLEDHSFWPDTSNFNLAITVLGFCVAALVGTKLTIAVGRFYALEELICKTVGTLRVIEQSTECRTIAHEWGRQLHRTFQAGPGNLPQEIRRLRGMTDELTACAAAAGANAPALSAFSQNTALLIHRMLAPTPAAYNAFLGAVMLAYVSVLILATPSPLGIFLAPLIAGVMGGIHYLTQDIDDALDYGPYSLIDVRLEPIEAWLATRHTGRDGAPHPVSSDQDASQAFDMQERTP